MGYLPAPNHPPADVDAHAVTVLPERSGSLDALSVVEEVKTAGHVGGVTPDLGRSPDRQVDAIGPHDPTDSLQASLLVQHVGALHALVRDARVVAAVGLTPDQVVPTAVPSGWEQEVPRIGTCRLTFFQHLPGGPYHGAACFLHRVDEHRGYRAIMAGLSGGS